jgi:TonB family protein
MKGLLACAALIVAFAGSAAVNAEVANPRFTLRWTVSLDATGRVTKLASADNVIDAVRDPLDTAIRRWQFVPGSVAGHPAATDTMLTVDVTLVPAGEDKFAVRVDDARTGGGAQRQDTKPPKYPMDAIRHRRQGMVVLKVDYDASGHVVSVVPHEGAPAVAADLQRSATVAVKRWNFSPEVVGGHALAGSAIVPICFEIFDTGTAPPYSGCGWTPPGTSTMLRDSDVLAIEPAARLLTDVAGRTL